MSVSTDTRLPRAFKPVRHAAYRWLLVSLLCAMLSEGVWLVAVVWEVIHMGGSATAFSMVSAASALGLVVSTLGGGVLADRVSQKKILVALELVKLVLLAVVSVLAFAELTSTVTLCVAALGLGLVAGLYYPAYSALVPQLVAEDELLAVNGIEAMARPALQLAGGPALAALVIGLSSPTGALMLAAVLCLGAAGGAAMVRAPQRPARSSDEPKPSISRDLAEGFTFVARTPWLLGTLLFACLLVLVVVGPIDVLVPFAVKDQVGGDALDHSFVLAAWGLGGVIGALIVSSRPMPRRYLTVMVLLWGVAALPMIGLGLARELWIMIISAGVMGILFEAPQVIWATLLQRRVPAELLGRVSSLDFFVSLVLMPASMALAGPLAHIAGTSMVFIVAAVIPLPLAFITLRWAKMAADEKAHPLHDDAEPEKVLA